MKKLFFLILLLFVFCKDEWYSSPYSKEKTFPISKYKGSIIIGKEYDLSKWNSDTLNVKWTLKNDSTIIVIVIENLEIDKYYSKGDTIK